MYIIGTHTMPRLTKYYFTQYNDNTYRITRVRNVREKGWETEKEYSLIPQTESEELTRISLSRTKRRIRELSLSNDFEYFATLTINSKNCDRYSLSACQEMLKKHIKAYKRKYGEFAYIFITEKHKDRCFSLSRLSKGVK